MKNSDLLKSVRGKVDWTQKQMAEYLEINSSYYSQLESAKRPISDWILKRVKLLSEPQPASLSGVSQVKHIGDSIVERLRAAGKLFSSLGLDVYTDKELWAAHFYFQKARRNCPAEALPIYEYVLCQIEDELQLKRTGEIGFTLMPEDKAEEPKGTK